MAHARGATFSLPAFEDGEGKKNQREMNEIISTPLPSVGLVSLRRSGLRWGLEAGWWVQGMVPSSGHCLASVSLQKHRARRQGWVTQCLARADKRLSCNTPSSAQPDLQLLTWPLFGQMQSPPSLCQPQVKTARLTPGNERETFL